MLENQAEILIVDDAPENLNLLKSILEEKYTIKIATTAKEAIEKVKQHQPDLVLLDIRMPDVDGYELFRELKSMVKEDFPIIFLSALNDTKEKLKAFSMGASDYIEKPFHVDEVNARVTSHLKLSKQNLLIKRQNRELKVAKKKLDESEKLRFLEEVSAKIIHDINNPVSYIQAGIEAIEKDINDLTHYFQEILKLLNQEVEESLYQRIKMIFEEESYQKRVEGLQTTLMHTKQGSKRIGQIIQGLRNSYNNNLKEWVNPIDILNETKHIIETISNKKILFEVNYHSSEQLKCSPSLLYQLFLNILVNAEESIKNSGIIKLSTKRTKKNLKIEIEDNGGGIDQKIKEQLFEPYFTTKRKVKGSGLGLAICREIVTDLGGKLTADSKNEWTKFMLKFPI